MVTTPEEFENAAAWRLSVDGKDFEKRSFPKTMASLQSCDSLTEVSSNTNPK